MYNRIITMKNSIEFPQKKIENRTTIRSSNLTSNTPKRIEIRISRAICPPMFIVALFTVSKRKTTFTSIECCCSVARSCSTLCDPMDCSTPGFPVLHYLPEFAQTHVHWVSDAIQPSHPLSSPSLPAFSLSQPHGLFQWVSSSYQVAKVLDPQNQSFQWILKVDRWIRKKMHIHTMEYYSALKKKRKQCHTWQCGWIWRTLC